MKEAGTSEDTVGINLLPVTQELGTKIFDALLSLINEIPNSDEKAALDPVAVAREIVGKASLKAAGISGTLALPPGPAGWLTILPDLIAVWHVQRQMISDIATVYGKRPQLTSEAMLYCLFRHAAAQAVRDLVTRIGERLLVRRPTLRVIQTILRRVGIKITQRIAGAGIVRLLPIIGALGVAGYAYYDTGQVGQTAIEFFGSTIDVDDGSKSLRVWESNGKSKAED
jgi:hypothetical protein